ncbi:MAG: adenosylcobinamide amidohydrolase [Acidimicrobiales bacterium]
MELEVGRRHEAGQSWPLLVWRSPTPMWCISSAPLGGGLGRRRWVLNAQVPHDYDRRDPHVHLAELAAARGLAGDGVGLLTAADVDRRTSATDGGVSVVATVGLGWPLLAAAPGDVDETPVERVERVGTVNIVAVLPERLGDAALVNAVGTMTEAKCQALADAGLAATGTATDAVCVLCPDAGVPQAFGGPRSVWGSRLARATHAAVLAGARQWR